MGSVDIPKKYKAAVYDKPGTISTKIEELDTPEPGPGEVLVNLYALFSLGVYNSPASTFIPTNHFQATSIRRTWKTIPSLANMIGAAAHTREYAIPT